VRSLIRQAASSATMRCQIRCAVWPLFARSLPVKLQNLIYETCRCRDLELRSFRLLPRLRNSAADRFSHHAPVHAQFHAELVLSADLFEKLHL